MIASIVGDIPHALFELKALHTMPDYEAHLARHSGKSLATFFMSAPLAVLPPFEMLDCVMRSGRFQFLASDPPGLFVQAVLRISDIDAQWRELKKIIQRLCPLLVGDIAWVMVAKKNVAVGDLRRIVKGIDPGSGMNLMHLYVSELPGAHFGWTIACGLGSTIQLTPAPTPPPPPPHCPIPPHPPQPGTTRSPPPAAAPCARTSASQSPMSSPRTECRICSRCAPSRSADELLSARRQAQRVLSRRTLEAPTLYNSTFTTAAHVPTAHARMLPSTEALNSRSPRTSSPRTPPLWPVRVASSTPVSSSHTRMVRSPEPLMSFRSH